MGHRRNRKRERRYGGRGSDFEPFLVTPAPSPACAPPDDAIALYFLTGEEEPRTPPGLSCGGCVEFVEDSLTGRGECLHPGSGILRPWGDTPACDFHTARRRR